MDSSEFQKLVAAIKIGKVLPDAIYLHVSALPSVDQKLHDFLMLVTKAIKIDPSEWNIVKLYKRHYKLSLLNYPNFDTYPYPPLSKSHSIDLAKIEVRSADYSRSLNPPILHRRETLLTRDHPSTDVFSAFTLEGETVGLYENTRKIGFKNQWHQLIKRKGYALDESGHLIPLFEKARNDEDRESNVEIQRHRTAIDRNQLSRPMQIIARHGYLDGQYSIFDYGCGKGDDLRELEAHGIDAAGWDPNFYPEADIAPAEIVNLGFVLNVIEDREERDETLKNAWSFTERFLVVSVMVAGESMISQFKPYKDGVVTKTNTFQKYYAQSEFKLYVETILDTNVIALATGVFIIFKDSIEEQEFLLRRHKVARTWSYKTKSLSKKKTPKISEAKFTEHETIFRSFWATALDLGRIPASDEFDFSDELKSLAGSNASAFKALGEFFGVQDFETSERKRRDDLLVYFAMSLFEKRRPYTRLPISLQRDIKAFFNNHTSALDHARELLFSVGDAELIEAECNLSFKALKTGLLEDAHSYTIHKSTAPLLTPTLRTYIGCASTLYGTMDDVDLIKIHMTSGKVTFLEYDDWNKKEPSLNFRIKVKMRDQDFDVFDHRLSNQTVNNKKIFT